MNFNISNKKLFLLFLFLMLSSSSLKSQVTQQWAKAYNYSHNTSSYGYKIKCDKQNNVYLLGITRITPESQPSICLLKFNSNGVTQWIARYDNGFNGYNYPWDMTIDSSGNIYIVGTSQRDSLANNLDLILLKYSPIGSLILEKRYFHTGNIQSGGLSIKLDKIQNIYIVGGIWDRDIGFLGTNYILTLKCNTKGDIIWFDKFANGIIDCIGKFVGLDENENVYSSGYVYNDTLSTYTGFYLQKLTSSGNVVWRRSKFFHWESYPNAMEVSPNGNIYLGGGITHSSSSSVDMGILKFDSSGNLIWTKIFNHEFENIEGGSYDFIHDIKIDKKENVYFTGRDIVPGNYLDIATGKVDSSGNTVWLNHFDPRGSDDDVGISLDLDDSNNVYVTGITGFSQGSDVVTLRINNNGKFKWHKIFSSMSPYSSDEGRSIAIDTQNNILVGGFSRTTPGTVDMIAIKYSQTTSVKNENEISNIRFELFQNYPNPFNPRTTIEFNVKNPAIYEVKIFDILGKLIEIPLSKQLQSGKYNINWNAEKYPSGIYFYGLYKDGVKLEIKKMIYVK